jgi:hypothetical protein
MTIIQENVSFEAVLPSWSFEDIAKLKTEPTLNQRRLSHALNLFGGNFYLRLKQGLVTPLEMLDHDGPSGTDKQLAYQLLQVRVALDQLIKSGERFDSAVLTVLGEGCPKFGVSGFFTLRHHEDENTKVIILNFSIGQLDLTYCGSPSTEEVGTLEHNYTWAPVTHRRPTRAERYSAEAA